MKIDGIIIRTNEMFPPLVGIYKYFATVEVLYIVDESGRHKANKSFEDTYGQTEEEAKEKMQQKVRDWVKSQWLNKGSCVSSIIRKGLIKNL